MPHANKTLGSLEFFINYVNEADYNMYFFFCEKTRTIRNDNKL